MTPASHDQTPGEAAPSWVRTLAPYRDSSSGRGIAEIALTAIPLLLLWGTIVVTQQLGFWWCLFLVVPAAGFLARLFMIQHDCGHGAFFPNRAANDWVGRVIGVLTLTPYDCWRRSHAVHHASSGNLDKRGTGDLITMTVAEYLALPWLGRLLYRAYRNPAFILFLGPAYLFLLQQRLPVGLMRQGWRPWLSVMATNLAMGLLVGAGIWWLGIGDFLLIHLPIVLIAASLGGWLFFVQHQFEETSWDAPPDWTFPDAALNGSSHYDLPPVLSWLTADIGVHHVHHLASRIPFYRLKSVLRDHPQLAAAGRITLLDSIRCVPLALWDEDSRRLISFRHMRRNLAAAR